MDEEETNWDTLLLRVRQGDASAERELVERLFPRVAARIRTWKARRETVEDLAQEVFIRMFRHLHQQQGGSFSAWVDSIARHVCYDALRKQRIRPEWNFTDISEGKMVEPAAEMQQADTDAAEVVATLLALMPPEQAWLIREVELEQRSIGEVSAAMGWTAVGGRLRLFRARQSLRKVYHQWNTPS